MGRRLRRFAAGLAVLAAISAVLYGGLAAYAATRPPKPRHDFFRAPIRNLAHRGGRVQAPEATLPAFAAAAAAGADALEMDVRVTADGALVVIHDETVDRTTDGRGPVAGMTLEALRSLNAGHRFQAPDGGFPYRETPVRIPTFREVIEAHPDLSVVVEMKTGTASEPLCRAIRAADRESEILVAAFARKTLEDFREACPGVATGAGFREVVSFLLLARLGLTGLYDAPADALLVSESSGPIRVVTSGFLRAARRVGLPVIVWTVNRTEDMTRLLDLGVDGILTDDPAALHDVLEARR